MSPVVTSLFVLAFVILVIAVIMTALARRIPRGSHGLARAIHVVVFIYAMLVALGVVAVVIARL